VHQRPFQQRKQTCSAPRPEEPGFVVHRDKLAVWQLPSKVYLLSFLSLLQWTLLHSWLSIACATCCRVVWMQEAGGLPTHSFLHVAFHSYLARHNRLAVEASPVIGPTKQSSGNPGNARHSSNHNVMASNHPQAVTYMFLFVLSHCRICRSAHL
jgi:hypothetical protein